MWRTWGKVDVGFDHAEVPFGIVEQTPMGRKKKGKSRNAKLAGSLPGLGAAGERRPGSSQKQ